MRNWRKCAVAAAFMGVAAAAAIQSQVRMWAQEGRAASLVGAYTKQQAMRGKEAYSLNCATCHGPDLTGAVAPALTGSAFIEKWKGQSLDDFYTRVSTTMPEGESMAGSLPNQTYLDIVAFIMESNGLSPGDAELKRDSAAMAKRF